MKVRVGDLVRFPLPSDARFVPGAIFQPLPAPRWLQFMVTPTMLEKVLAGRRRRRRRA